MKNKSRDQHHWDLSVLYQSDDDPQIEKDLAAVTKANETFAAKWRRNPRYLTDPETLLQLLQEREQLLRFYGSDGKPGYYFQLRSSQDLNDPKLRARLNKISEVGKRNVNLTRFISLNLGSVSRSQQKIFLKSPLLKQYHYYLDRLFARAKRFLSDPEEKVFSLLGSSAHSRWTQMLDGFLAREQREVLLEDSTAAPRIFSDINALLSHPKKDVRDSAAHAINDILIHHVDVAENEFNAVLETKKVSDELRGYSRPDAARHLADDIDSSIVDQLVSAVSDRFDISQRYYQLKAKLLGLHQLAYHERGVEYGEFKDEYSYEQSVAIVRNSLAKVDQGFADILTMFVANQQIDVYPQVGKRGGAFCTFDLVEFPTYIMLNHTNKFRDVTTLAHEVGHGINDELVRKAQSPLYVGTPLSTAEVASTFMEDFTIEELLTQVADEQRLAIMMLKLNDDISTIMRQIAAYRFEQEIHREYRDRGYLSKTEIGQIFQKHMSAYMGPAVEQSPGSENWWVGWHHFRRPFYVYSYASGLLISKALQRSLRKNPQFIGKVKDFLSAGLSASPKEIFRQLGVDIESTAFWNQGLDEVEDLLTQTRQLAEKLGKL